MKLLKRMYQGEDDYWRLRAFLREVFILNGCRELSWQTARWDYWYFFGNTDLEHYDLSKVICLWETENGQTAAFITPESRGYAYLQVHPHYRTPELEAEMLLEAENQIAEPNGSGQRQVTAWAHQYDELRKRVLQERGYTRGDWPEHQFCRSLNDDIPEMYLPSGYIVRSLGDETELPARSWLSWRAFHPDEPERYLGWDWYPHIQQCPLYRRDLDLVAVAPDGELAAFCTVWYDDVTRTGYFEPVGTSPDHQRKGLARAVMTEGMHRLKRMGARYVTVAGYSEAATALYASLMSPDRMLYERWHKSLGGTS